MQKRTLAILAVLALAGSAALLPAQEGARGGASTRASSAGALFNFRNLQLDLGPYNDGVLSGGGLKYWIKDTMALRGLMSLYYNSYTPAGGTDAETTSVLSLGAGLEFHPANAAMSPYFGLFAGGKMTTISDVTLYGFYGGGMVGVEYRFVKTLSVFAEYQVRIGLDSSGFTLSVANSTAASDGAVFGICVYFR